MFGCLAANSERKLNAFKVLIEFMIARPLLLF